ncbi:MAG TPA: hypothetical protein VGL72_15885 [Bryobacteraceae bacterium]
MAVTTLFTAAAHAQALRPSHPDQIKAVLNSPVEPGKPGLAKDSNDCTRSDANGEDRVYISSSPAPLSKPPTLVAVTSRLPR